MSKEKTPVCRGDVAMYNQFNICNEIINETERLNELSGEENDLFKDLKIKFYGVTSNTDSPAENYLKTYEGKDAYNFFAVLNNKSKKIYDNPTEGIGFKPQFFVKYKYFSTQKYVSFELGDPYTFNSDGENIRFYGGLPMDCREEAKKEEEKYLSDNPSIREYNEYSPRPYQYMIEKRMFDFLNDLPENGREYDFYFPLVGKTDLRDMENIYLMDMNRYSLLNINPNQPNDFVIVSSYERPQEINHYFSSRAWGEDSGKNKLRDGNFIIYSVLDEQEVQSYKLLNSLKYSTNFVPTNPYCDYMAEKNCEYTGLKALKEVVFDYYTKEISSLYNDHFSPKVIAQLSFDRIPQKEHILKTGIAHEISDRSFNACFINENDIEKFKKINDFAIRYYGSSISDMNRLNTFVINSHKVQYDCPDRAPDEILEKEFEDLEKLINKKTLNSQEIHDLAQYYIKKGNIINNVYPFSYKECNMEIVKEMINNGLSDNKITSVFTAIDYIMKKSPKVRQEDVINNGLKEIMVSPEIKELKKNFRDLHKAVKKAGFVK